jgi:ring-1,2-phenylacetyl-CoA epoxidase subunit PaaA/ring-1,2-phenylacetyl-CoA epoxidase subunit PaaC
MSESTFALATDEATGAANLVVAVADNKFFLAHRLATWGVGAPFLESSVACTAIAQEEAGHARVLYSLLEHFPSELAPVPLEREDDRARKYAVSFLRAPSTSWIGGIAALTLIDRALTTVLAACVESSFGELRKRALRILGDESFHRKYADGRVRELAASPGAAAKLEVELSALLPETLCWFGPPAERGLELLVDAAILSQRNEELRQEFLASLGPLVEDAGLRLPIARTGDGTWTYPELPWADWHSLERRLTTSA